jgi:hypothetical protein
MATVKSGINKVGDNYYQSITMEFADGGVGTTMYRVNADGSGGVPIYDVDKPAGSTSLIKSFDSNATVEEQRLLSDPNSQLSQVRSQQVTSSNPYADPTPVQNSTLAQAGGGSGNAATTASNPDAQGGSTPTSPQQPSQQASGATLVYPNDLASTDQDRIMFTTIEIAKSTAVNPSNALLATEPSFRSVPGSPSVILPIQSGISDQNSVNWGAGEINELQRQLVNASIRAQRSSDNLGNVALEELKNVTDLFKDVVGSGLANIYFAEQAVGVQNLLSRITGSVLNPNLELLFQGPQLRPFNFTFKLSPRSLEEAKTVKSIINYFKKNMAVRKDATGIFLKSPYAFKIEYQHKGGEHPGINKIKQCALTNCSVDYTPLGTYMTYPEGTMVSYTMSLQFQELTPIYDTDYKDPSQIEY